MGNNGHDGIDFLRHDSLD